MSRKETDIIAFLTVLVVLLSCALLTVYFPFKPNDSSLKNDFCIENEYVGAIDNFCYKFEGDYLTKVEIGKLDGKYYFVKYEYNYVKYKGGSSVKIAFVDNE